jgi:hypothetical protein
MEQQIAEAIGPLIALLGIGTFSLIGLRMFLGYRGRRLELTSRAPAGPADALVEELRQEVQQLRSDVGDLHERVDFAERMLARGKD